MSKIKLPRKTIAGIVNALNQAAPHVGGEFPKLMYAIIYNADHLGAELVRIEKVLREPEDFNKERLALCEEASNKDANGKAIQFPTGPKTTRFDIPPERWAKFEADLKELEKKHGMDEKRKEWQAFLDEEEEYEVRKLVLDEKRVPPGLTAAILVPLCPLIEFTEAPDAPAGTESAPQTQDSAPTPAPARSGVKPAKPAPQKEPRK